MTAQAYVVDLAWLRSTPWRERLAATFDPQWLRRELRAIVAVTVRHHQASTASATLLVGWLASRLGWKIGPLAADGDALAGGARGGKYEVTLRPRGRPRAAGSGA